MEWGDDCEDFGPSSEDNKFSQLIEKVRSAVKSMAFTTPKLTGKPNEGKGTVHDSPFQTSHGGVEEAKEDPDEASPGVIQPICTITLQISYKPSPKDQREQLYDLLNKTSQRKAAALENLRKISMTMTRAAGGDSPSKGSSSAIAKPSVKPGFLNKKKKEPSRLEELYERTFGPNSILRKSLALALISRNYIIFFGAVTFMHFKGQVLSLPPPV